MFDFQCLSQLTFRRRSFRYRCRFPIFLYLQSEISRWHTVHSRSSLFLSLLLQIPFFFPIPFPAPNPFPSPIRFPVVFFLPTHAVPSCCSFLIPQSSQRSTLLLQIIRTNGQYYTHVQLWYAIGLTPRTTWPFPALLRSTAWFVYIVC